MRITYYRFQTEPLHLIYTQYLFFENNAHTPPQKSYYNKLSPSIPQYYMLHDDHSPRIRPASIHNHILSLFNLLSANFCGTFYTSRKTLVFRVSSSCVNNEIAFDKVKTFFLIAPPKEERWKRFFFSFRYERIRVFRWKRIHAILQIE